MSGGNTIPGSNIDTLHYKKLLLGKLPKTSLGGGGRAGGVQTREHYSELVCYKQLAREVGEEVELGN